MEYNVAEYMDGDEVVAIFTEQHDQQQTDPVKLWNTQEWEITEEAPIDVIMMRRRRFTVLASLVLIGVLVIGFVSWQAIQAYQYQHIVHQNVTLITQQSVRETTCFQHAQTAPQRDACARTANAMTAGLQRQFSAVTIPVGQQASATAMQTAYAALAAATCYDADSHGVDAACLSDIVPRLHVAILDANDAAQN